MRDGRWSAAVPTDRATDPQQVDMPARNKEGVSGGHASSITRAIPFCPESFSPPNVVGRQRPADAHAWCQLRDRPGYSGCHPPFADQQRPTAPFLLFVACHPYLIQPTGGSEGPAVGRCWQVAKCRPGIPCGTGDGTADKSCCIYRLPGCRQGSLGPRVRRQDQAAFARRILRRRSEARSSSFKPPQVPYFSGRDTA
jgi:hypothetical protein